MNQSSESLLAGALGDARIVLQTAARHRRVLTYADLAREASTAFDLGPSSPELARILCELLVDDASNDRPLLSSLVINKQTGRPGKGFFRLARHYYRFRDDEQFWLDELTAAYEYYGAAARTSRRRRSGRRVPEVHISTESHILSFFD